MQWNANNFLSPAKQGRNCREREVNEPWPIQSFIDPGRPCRGAAVYQLLDGMGSSSASRQLPVVVLPVDCGDRRPVDATRAFRYRRTAHACSQSIALAPTHVVLSPSLNICCLPRFSFFKKQL
jgi:hypothetical protein